MFRRVAVLVGVVLLLGTAVGAASTRIFFERQVVIPEGGLHETKLRFRGGERACVILVGDHDPASPTVLRVFDTRGRLVGESKANNDTVAVIWYPAETADYRIEAENLGTIHNVTSWYFQGVDKR